MGISIWQLIILLVIVLILFGTKKLRHMGSDLGGAVKGFKKALEEGEATDSPPSNPESAQPDQPSSTSEPKQPPTD